MEIRSTQPSFGSKILVIDSITKSGIAARNSKLKNQPMHFGPINYLGYMDYFKNGLKPLSKQAQAKKLDIVIAGNTNGIDNPYMIGYYDINVYTGKARKRLIHLNPIDPDKSFIEPEGSFASTKKCIDELFRKIQEYIDTH